MDNIAEHLTQLDNEPIIAGDASIGTPDAIVSNEKNLVYGAIDFKSINYEGGLYEFTNPYKNQENYINTKVFEYGNSFRRKSTKFIDVKKRKNKKRMVKDSRRNNRGK